MCLINKYMDSLIVDGRSEDTITAYKTDLLDFQEFMINMLEKNNQLDVLKSVKLKDINEYKRYLASDKKNRKGTAGLSPTSINRKIASLKGFYRYLEDMEFIESDPTSRVKNVRVEDEVTYVLTATNLGKIIDEIDNEYIDANTLTRRYFAIRNKLMVILSGVYGLRAEEVNNLKLDNIIDNTLWLYKTKGGKNRQLTINDIDMKILNEYLNVRDEFMVNYKLPIEDDTILFMSKSRNTVCPIDKNGKTSSKPLNEMLRKYVVRVWDLKDDVEQIHWHSLRHTAITSLISQNYSIPVVSKFAGHSTPTITLNIYTHINNESVKEMCLSMNRSK